MSVRGVGKFGDLCTVRSWADVGKNEDVICKAVESMEERRPDSQLSLGVGMGSIVAPGSLPCTILTTQNTR